jgi:hypothetical protein
LKSSSERFNAIVEEFSAFRIQNIYRGTGLNRGMLNYSGNRNAKSYGKGLASHDPYIHSPDSIREAWREIHCGYERPPGYLDEMLDRELKGNDGKAVVADDKLAGVVLELCMLDRLDWLREERGWNVSYPVRGSFRKGGYMVSSASPGKRVEVFEYGKNGKGSIVDEFDGVALIEGEYSLLEGKGRHSFNTGKVMRKVGLFNDLFVRGNGQDGPVCIVVMANDHRAKAWSSRAMFEYRGGNVWFLKNLHSSHIDILANEYLARNNAKPAL